MARKNGRGKAQAPSNGRPTASHVGVGFATRVLNYLTAYSVGFGMVSAAMVGLAGGIYTVGKPLADDYIASYLHKRRVEPLGVRLSGPERLSGQVFQLEAATGMLIGRVTIGEFDIRSDCHVK